MERSRLRRALRVRWKAMLGGIPLRRFVDSSFFKPGQALRLSSCTPPTPAIGNFDSRISLEFRTVHAAPLLLQSLCAVAYFPGTQVLL